MFTSIAAGVYLARTQPLDVNVTLVVGSRRALLVDTLSTEAQARSLLAEVRAITDRPLDVVNTHFHFDHCFGNAVFATPGCTFHAHPTVIDELTTRADHWRHTWFADYAESDPPFAEALAAVEIHPPDHAVPHAERLDLGDRSVVLRHPGRGHTAGDLTIEIDDTGVLVAGDLIEEGAPPDFGDGYPLEWPEAVAAILRQPFDVVVPGHGAPVDRAFVTDFHQRLSAFDWLIRAGHRDGGTVDSVAARAPWPAEAIKPGVRRGYAALG